MVPVKMVHGDNGMTNTVPFHGSNINEVRISELFSLIAVLNALYFVLGSLDVSGKLSGATNPVFNTLKTP